VFDLYHYSLPHPLLVLRAVGWERQEQELQGLQAGAQLVVLHSLTAHELWGAWECQASALTVTGCLPCMWVHSGTSARVPGCAVSHTSCTLHQTMPQQAAHLPDSAGVGVGGGAIWLFLHALIAYSLRLCRLKASFTCPYVPDPRCLITTYCEGQQQQMHSACSVK
jgi:hypothetical protein